MGGDPRETGASRGEEMVLVAGGALSGDQALEVAAALRRANPREYPVLTVDLRGVAAVDPLIVHALFVAWLQRGRRTDSVRILIVEGPVKEYLRSLGLGRMLTVANTTAGQENLAGEPADPEAEEPTDGPGRDDADDEGCAARPAPGGELRPPGRRGPR